MKLLRNLMSALRSGINPSLEDTNVKPLSSLEALDACLTASGDAPVFIFKHSTACPISSEAYRHVGAYAEGEDADRPDVYLVKVIEERPVSDKIAEVLGVAHRSPQLILVHNRECVWTASHYGIREERIREAAKPS